MTVIESEYKADESHDEPEPLRMEHIKFPLGMLLVGLLFSVFCLIAEIIIHRLRKSQIDVTIATLEEPGVSRIGG